MSKSQPVIVTDLDGTLLDHDTYSFEPARPSLSLIAARGYPLVLNSSKTRAEMLSLQQELGLRQPFICENGAAVYLPDTNGEDWSCQCFAPEREQWLPWIHELRDKYRLPFQGFSDWSVAEIATITGLPPARAELAAQRNYSEPLLWQGDEASRQEFEQLIGARQLRLVRGGRFFSLQGLFDKAQAMQWLRQHYQRDAAVTMIALGDSPNDAAMLNAADIAVVIKSKQSESIHVDGPGEVIRTTLPGPEGWQQAMTTIIGGFDRAADSTGAQHG